jgi:Fic family protein
MEWKNTIIEYDFRLNTFPRIDLKKQSLAKARPLPTIVLQKINEALNMEWTYNSNSIEGNTLTLQETRLVLQEGITVKGKSLREHFEAVNHHDAIAYIEQLVSPNYILTEHDMLKTHGLALDKIEKDFAGRFRTSGVRITGANFTPPNALKVYDMMHELMDWANSDGLKLHPLVMATIFHHRFVWIHPFFDGNGRTVRLLFNLLLMKQGYPPAIILRADRKKYYDALNKANDGDYNKLLLLVCQAMERSLDIYLSNLDNYADDYMSISNLVKEPSMEYSQEYISLLARRGKLDAYKEGNVWYTSEAAVKNYVAKRKRQR